TVATNELFTYQLAMDLVPPDAPAINPVTGDNILSAAEAREANPAPIAVSGTAEAGSTVHVVWRDAAGNDDHAASAVADENGNWTAVFNGQLIIDGVYSVIATAVDLAGNTSTASSVSVRVETNVPTAPEFNAVTGDNMINAAEAGAGVELTGVTTPGTKVFVTFNGIEYEA